MMFYIYSILFTFFDFLLKEPEEYDEKNIDKHEVKKYCFTYFSNLLY